MRILLKAVFACALAMLIYSCAGRPVKPVPEITSPEISKEEIIALINDRMPSSCFYSGRVRFYLTKGNYQSKMSALVNKSCSGDMDVKILGLFGAVYAEINVDANGFTVYERGKDVTDNVSDAVNSEDLTLLKRFFFLPAEMPDKSFKMIIQRDNYLFYSDNVTIIVDPAYNVNKLIYPSYTVEYVWGDISPESIGFRRGNTVFSMEFIDKWKLN